MAVSSHQKGVALCLLAGALWSISGVLIRTMENPDVWRISFYRSGTLFLTMLTLLLGRYRGDLSRAFRGAGPRTLLAACFVSGASLCFIASLMLTTVANSMFMLAGQPLAAAALAWLVLREPMNRSTWIAMLVAVAGVGLMVADAVAAGNLLGNMLAMISTFWFGAFVVTLRATPAMDSMAMLAVTGFIVMVAGTAGLLIGGGGFGISLHDLILCVIMGTVQMTLGTTVFTMGARLLPVAPVTVLALSEVVLGPFWVFLVYGEQPTLWTLAGGGLVLAAVTGLALVAGNRSQPAAR